MISIPLSYGITSFTAEGTYQGTQNSDVRSSFSKLNYVITYQDGVVSGSTDAIPSHLISFKTLTFVNQEQNPLRTLINARVEGVTDHLKIGDKYCFDLPRWNFTQEVIVNGKSYNILKQLSGTQKFNSNTQTSFGMGIEFQPQFIESQLSNKGVKLKNNDDLIWKVTANNRFTIFEGYVTVDPAFPENPPHCVISIQDDRDGDGFQDDLDNCPTFAGNSESGCVFVPSKPIPHVSGSVGYDVYAVGMTYQMKLKYLDPTIQLIGNDPTAPDIDVDGLSDSLDSCTFSAEIYNGFEDTDGCPDIVQTTQTVESGQVAVVDEDGNVQVVPITDSDNDNILDELDQCKFSAETYNGFQDSDGCPDGLSKGVNDVNKAPTITSVLVSENPETNLHADDVTVTGENGITQECDNSVNDCDQVIEQQIKNIELALKNGNVIKLPFEPTIFNFMVLSGIIALSIIILVMVKKKI